MTTTLRPTPPDDQAAALPRSPAARRLRSIRWFNLRLLLGVVLVLAAVIGGARIIGAADKTTTVWAAAVDLAEGVQLTEADLVAVEVRIEDGTGSYLAANTVPQGKTLLRDITAGELIPASAVGTASDQVSLALSVPAQQLPASAQRGDRVSIYASTDATGSSTPPESAAVVAEAVTLVEISGRSDGALSVGSADLQVVIAVPSCAVQQILDATNGRQLSVVVLDDSAAPTELC
ncbi:flagellar biosynthesis protein FlgA [Epidermidibacterium keratini]|uniref:Flagellar biosynthesis protein FlgA n=1 Tax=Epidermidibacterium keratini TaxID=1891644 RepID=A0A7L4YSR7_9ACTN|nr:SAF domain-containing protein [Epidermidibacterium keratini]QHC01577.1 flagellar biosynthesis protein FlgA [Epidermidibacterium keratini]